MPEGTEGYYRSVAQALKPTFPRKALAALDRALLLIELNVSQKILFTNLVNQFYTLQNQ